ncbi:MAG: Rrf2 family transcriptional regulator [Saprospiraceae bacterium]|nr:Rrf2 family transcriptional regulator [Saprospiraceae bacterium]
MLNKTCQYAIKAIIYMGTKVDVTERLRVKDVAEAIGSPEAFTSKILQKLVAHGIVYSTKGGGGGFEVELDTLKKTSLVEVVKAVDHDSISEGCILGLPRCSDKNPCPVHTRYAPLRKQLNEELLEIMIYDIIHDSKQEYQFK